MQFYTKIYIYLKVTNSTLKHLLLENIREAIREAVACFTYIK